MKQLEEGWWWRPGKEPPLEYIDEEIKDEKVDADPTPTPKA